MNGGRLIQTVADLAALDVGTLAERAEPQRVLMCTPEHFDVIDVKNAFMEGNIGAVDRKRARAQWEALRQAFTDAGHHVLTIDGAPGLEDMVFAANQVLPGVDPDGSPYVVLSHMRHPSRRKEVPFYRDFFANHGYRILELPPQVELFEGQGDAIWHPGKQLLWGGYGHRTSLSAYAELSELLDVPVVALSLIHPSFYHLDTAFCVLGPDAVLIYPGAFTEAQQDLIRRLFPRVIETSEHEASEFFACNAHALDGKTVILQKGAAQTVAKLRAAGFEVIEVETSEFMKSGGSVFCMKMMMY
jgi:N-dimethylarginine dimethylaminohydrolase